MTQYIKRLLLVAVLLIVTKLTFAQPPDDSDPTNAPIDGGLSVLVAAGIGYGLKKSYQKKKQQKEE